MDTQRKRDMTVAGTLFAIATAGMVVLFTSGCRLFDKPTDIGSRVIDCGADVVRREWPRVLPVANNCISSLTEDPVRCLDAIPTALHVAIDTLACVVKHSGATAAAQAQASPDDSLSVMQAKRSREYIAAKGYTFKE